MNTTVAGLLTGLALGFAGYFGGFGAFIVVAAVGLAGLIVGHLARPDVHLTDYVNIHEGDRRHEAFESRRSNYEPAPRAEYRRRVR